MNASIEIDGLRKRFGPVQALDGMTFTVHPGQVTGFAGPNGAGKSTTIRVVVGLDAPDAGTAATGSGVLKISDLSSERVVAILTGHAIPFSEVSAHRATLEQAYLELTSQSVEYRAEVTS